jgi:hypothetical protein
LFEPGLEVLGPRLGENGQQQGVIDDEHEATFASLEIGDVGIVRRYRIRQLAIGAVGRPRKRCDSAAFTPDDLRKRNMGHLSARERRLLAGTHNPSVAGSIPAGPTC